MAAAQSSWNIDMCHTMRAMEAAVIQVAGISFPNASLQTQIPLVKKVEPALTKAFLMLSTLETEGLASRSEYTSFVTGFTALVFQFVPQLARLGLRLNLPASCNNGPAAMEQDVFWTLWRYLLTACVAFGSATQRGHDVVPVKQQPFYGPLYVAFHSLLVWLLAMSRSPAWLKMKQQHGLHGKNRDLMHILQQPMKLLVNMSFLESQSELHGHLDLLPPTFLPVLCCILSEQISSTPPIVPPAQLNAGIRATQHQLCLPTAESHREAVHFLLAGLSIAIHNLDILSEHAGYPLHLAFLKVPAVVHFLKVLLIWTAGKHVEEFLVDKCLPILGSLFKQYTIQSWGKDPSRACDSETNIESAGLLVHLNPLISRPVLETDARLLHALSILIHRYPAMPFHLYQIQHDIVYSWMHSMSHGHMPTTEVVAVMVRSVIGISKHFTSLALRGMRQLVGEKAKCHSKPTPRDSKGQHPELLGSASVGLGNAGPVSRSLLVLARFRGLMFIISDLQLQMACGEFSVNTGPASSELLSWCGMPGWAAAVEALHRGVNNAGLEGEAQHVTVMSSRAILTVGAPSSVAVLQGFVSLAGSVRKLLRFHLHSQTPHNKGEKRHHTCKTWRRDGETWSTQQGGKSGSISAPELTVRLLQNIIWLNTLPADGSCCMSGCRSNFFDTDQSGMVISREVPIPEAERKQGGKKVTRGKQNLSTPVTMSIASPETLGSCHMLYSMSYSDASHEPTLRLPLLQRLMAITLVNVVQVCLWRMECEGYDATNVERSKTPDWFASVLKECQYLQNLELRFAVISIMKSTLTGTRLAEVDVMFERYFMTNLPGRLLPGCCNQSCINLEGVSEAALKTQLCRGCRKARYCCLKCQRAAWLEGGHSAVCEK